MIVRHIYIEAQPSGLASKWTPKLITPASAVADLSWLPRPRPADTPEEQLRVTRWTPQLSSAADQMPWRRRAAGTFEEEALQRRPGWGPQLTAVPVVIESMPWRPRRAGQEPEDAALRGVLHWQPWLTVVPAPVDQLPWRPVLRLLEAEPGPPRPPRGWVPAYGSIPPPPPPIVTRQPEVYGSAAPGFLGGTSGAPGFVDPNATIGSPGTFAGNTTIGSPGFFTSDN